MNQSVPICSFEGDVSVCNQKKPSGPDHELMELLWRNGQVVLQSQTNRRTSFNPNESKQVQKPDHQTIKGDGSCGIPNNLIQDDEPVSWIHYSLEDSFEKEFCSNLFSDLPSSDPIEVDKTMRQFEEEKFVKFGSSNALHGFHNSSQQPKTKPPSTNVTCLEKQMPPPRLQYCNNNNSAPQNHNNLEELGKVVNFSQFTIPGKGILRCSSGQVIGKDESQRGEVRECSIMTVGSSHCGSNQILPEPHMSKASSNVDGTNVGLSAGQLKEDRVQMTLSQSEGGKKEIVDPTFTSSSGGSGSSFGRTCQQSAGDNNTNNKRKNRDAEESECQSEAAELESAGTKKSCQRSGSSRKSRAAEVHNLSERRRRDRINERMRALQELIPHCNKTDKASLLDEAIEYLKSLQLQLQVMWMGSGMAPMMFPGMQHYMSRMGIGMGISPPAMPSIHNPMHMTGVPLVDPQTTNHQPVLCQTPVLNPINYQNQMQNTSFPEQYARFMGFHPMQTLPQPINMFSRLGCQTVQQNQSIPQQGISSGPFGGSTNSMNGGLSGKIG